MIVLVSGFWYHDRQEVYDNSGNNDISVNTRNNENDTIIKSRQTDCLPYEYSNLISSSSLVVYGDNSLNSYLYSGGVSKYTNYGYGFSIIYPSHLITTSTFDTGYLKSNNWRQWGSYCFDFNKHVYNLSGENILQIQLRNEMNSDSSGNQIKFLSQLRIGVSDESDELRNCLVASHNETLVKSIIINKINFHVFRGGDAGLSNRIFTLSYRTIHDNRCFSVELVRSYNIEDRNDLLLSDITEFENIISSFIFI